INLFSLAGLAIAIGEIADATIVIVENCTAELSLHPFVTRSEKQEILVRSIASVTKPLLFSLLIILATIVIVENCTAELSLHPFVTRSEKQEILVRSIASVTKPLLFSLLIILAS